MYLPLCDFQLTSPNEDKFFSDENIARVSTPNTRPDATGLCEAVVSNGPCPTKHHTMSDFITQLFFMACWVVIGLTPFALTGLDFRIAVLISLPILAFAISMPVRWLISTHKERTLLRKAWKNNWLEFYPVLVGNFHHFDSKKEKNPAGDDRYYFHHARVMVFFPDGSTEVLPEIATSEVLDYSPERMKIDGSAIAKTSDDLRVSAAEINGWLLLTVLAGDPVSEGVLDIGLKRRQIGAALSRVGREWVPGFLN